MKEAQPETQKIIKWLGAGSINIFGRPFSGKDTQAKYLSKLFNAPVIGGGDIIRTSNHTSMKEHLKTGKLAPQNEYLSLILPHLSLETYDNKPLILSSLGRWKGEEQSIINSAKKAGHPLKMVIYLEIDEQTVITRWQKAKQLKDRGDRNDDNLNSIKTRLTEFNAKTLPVIEFYQNQGLLITVNGTLPRQNVTQAIYASLKKKILV